MFKNLIKIGLGREKYFRREKRLGTTVVNYSNAVLEMLDHFIERKTNLKVLKIWKRIYRIDFRILKQA